MRKRKKLRKIRLTKKTTKQNLKIKREFNKLKRRDFINLICCKCKRDCHIRVNDKTYWDKVDRKKYVCILCKKPKRR